MKIKIATIVSLIFILTSAIFASTDDCEQLIKSIEKGKTVRAVKILSTVEVDCTSIGNGSPLIAASRVGNQRMVKILVEKYGANVNKGVLGDGSPLIQAAGRGFLLIAKYLIGNGAKVDLEVKEDETPLIRAAEYGHLEMVKLLVKKGADVNKAVMGGINSKRELRSPLKMARRNKHKRVEKFLLENGALTK